MLFVFVQIITSSVNMLRFMHYIIFMVSGRFLMKTLNTLVLEMALNILL